MAHYLVIVESPTKMKTIAKLLGKGYKIEASMGHVRDLPKSQLGVDIENHFQPKYINIRGKAELINKLKKEAKAARKVFLATDPDREGEAISWHLAKLLDLDENAQCRITFNEITKKAVTNAIKSPRPINMDLVEAQQARRILDRIVGYKISDILWKKIKRGLSAGRVQSPATRLICDREEEIQSFVPEEYWSLTSVFRNPDGRSSFEAKFYGNQNEKIELKSREDVDKIISELDAAVYKVQKLKKSEKKRSPAAPFITSTFQQEAYRKLGYTTKKAMMIAQQLYEGVEIKGHGSVGLITYMRTDSTRIAEEAQIAAREYIAARFGNEYLPEEARQYKNRSAAQDAHEAIRPSYIEFIPDEIKDSLTTEQYKVYKLIWDRFIASQMAPAVYDTLTVDISAGDYIFRASGSRVRFPGFISVYTEGRDDEGEETEVEIPDLYEGQIVELKELVPKQHFTQPPPRYTEATLVKALEENGIGRPSTYATIISTILERGYVERDKKNLVPTELGKIVTAIMKEHFQDIVDIEFTAQLEKKLDEVEEGKLNWVELLEEFYNTFSKVLEEADINIKPVELQTEETNIPCEKCGRMMVIKHGRFGKFLACPGFPECRNTKSLFEEVGVACPKCGGKILAKKSKKGRKYYGCENNPKCDYMTWDMPLKEKCPDCGSFLLRKGGRKAVLVCSNENCGYSRPEEKENDT